MARKWEGKRRAGEKVREGRGKESGGNIY